MNILYLSEDYVYTKVHHNLLSSLVANTLSLKITVFCMQRCNGRHINRMRFTDLEYNAILPYFKGNSRLYKYYFPYKISKKLSTIKETIDLSKIDIIHAATLFSEGAVALQLYKEYGIPYLVAVRGSDLNFYFKYMFHLQRKGLEILKNAKKIIFITELSQQHFFELPFVKSKYEIFDTIVLPNGIDQYWFDNPFEMKFGSSPNHLLFIGRFDENKNVLRVMDAVKYLKNKYPEIRLSLVGGKGNFHEKVLQRCQENPSMFKYWGEIYDKDKLSSVMRNSDIFIMASHSETFGLVYMEALTQGLPIIYTKGQGVDGCFKENIGEGVCSTDTTSIIEGIDKVICNYNDYTTTIPSIIDYSWKQIAEKYIDIYKEILNK